MLTWEHNPIEAFEFLRQSNLAHVSTQARQKSRVLHESALTRAREANATHDI